MKFCPKCGSMMLPKKTKEGLILECSSCGYTSEVIEAEKYKLIKPTRGKKELEIIEAEHPTLPTAKVPCPNCGNDKAYWWQSQTRGADEPSTQFYRCTKCGHIWREYT